MVADNLICRARWRKHCITGSSRPRRWCVKFPSSKTSNKAQHSFAFCQPCMARVRAASTISWLCRLRHTHACRWLIGLLLLGYVPAEILLSQRKILNPAPAACKLLANYPEYRPFVRARASLLNDRDSWPLSNSHFVVSMRAIH